MGTILSAQKYSFVGKINDDTHSAKATDSNLNNYISCAHSLSLKAIDAINSVVAGHVSTHQDLIDSIHNLGLPYNVDTVEQACSKMQECLLLSSNGGHINVMQQQDIFSSINNMRTVNTALERAKMALDKVNHGDTLETVDKAILSNIGKTKTALKDALHNLSSNGNVSSELSTTSGLRSMSVYISNILSSYQAIINQFGDLTHATIGAVYAFNMGVMLQTSAGTLDYLNNLSNIQSQVINPLAAGMVSMISAISQVFTKIWTQLQTDIAGTGSSASQLTNLPFLMQNSVLRNMFVGMGTIGLSPAANLNIFDSNGDSLSSMPIGGGQSGDYSPCTFSDGGSSTEQLLTNLNGVIGAYFGNYDSSLSANPSAGHIVITGGTNYNPNINSVAEFNNSELTQPCPSQSAINATNCMLQGIGFPYALNITNNGQGPVELVSAPLPNPSPGSTKNPIPLNPGSNPPSGFETGLDAYCSGSGLGGPFTVWEALLSTACVDLGDRAKRPPSTWTTDYLNQHSIVNSAYCGDVNTGSNFKLVFIDASVKYSNPPANAIAIPHDIFTLINSDDVTNSTFTANTNATWPYISYTQSNPGGPVAFLSIPQLIDLFQNRCLGTIGLCVDVSSSASIFGLNGIFSNVSALQSESQSSVQQMGNNVAQAPNKPLSVASDITQGTQTFRDQMDSLLQGILSGAVI